MENTCVKIGGGEANPNIDTVTAAIERIFESAYKCRVGDEVLRAALLMMQKASSIENMSFSNCEFSATSPVTQEIYADDDEVAEDI